MFRRPCVDGLNFDDVLPDLPANAPAFIRNAPRGCRDPAQELGRPEAQRMHCLAMRAQATPASTKIVVCEARFEPLEGAVGCDARRRQAAVAHQHIAAQARIQ